MLQEKLEKSYYTLQVQIFLGHSITHWAIFCVSLKNKKHYCEN